MGFCWDLDGVGEAEVAEVRADARRLQRQLSRMEHGETAQQHSSVVAWSGDLGGEAMSRFQRRNRYQCVDSHSLLSTLR